MNTKKEIPWALISLGVLVIVSALSYYAHLAGIISLGEIVPATIILAGVWILIIALIKAKRSSSYEMSAFVTMAWGTLIFAVGVVWFLTVRGYPLQYLIATFIALVGVLILVAGLRERTGK